MSVHVLGALTFSQGLPQGHLMPVHHHIPQLLLQLFADAQAVHCIGDEGRGGQCMDRDMEQGSHSGDTHQ